MQEVFTDEGVTSPDITSIEVIKSSTSEEVTVTAPDKINKIITDLFHVRLKKKRFNGVKNYSESYWVTIYANNERRFGITYYDPSFISVYTFKDRKHYNYKIIDNSDIETIKHLFK